MIGMRYAVRAAALVGLVAAACGGTAAPSASPSAAASAAPSASQAAASATAAPAPKKIVIGFTESATGAQQVASKKQTEGIKLWVEDVTKAGGIKLKSGQVLMPELKSYDDESKIDRVQALYTKLINDDKVDFLLSPYSSNLVKAAAIVGDTNNKLMITAGGADDATMEQNLKNIYQVYTPASAYLTGAIDLMLKLDPTIKKVAIVNEKDSFSTSVIAAAKPYAEGKGLQVVVNEGYESNTTDFSAVINKVVAAAPDAFIGGGHFQDGTTIAKQLFEKKIAARFVALLVAPPEPTFKDIGDAAQFIVGPSQWEPQVKYSADGAKAVNVSYYGPTPQDFTSRYTAKFGAAPSYHSAGGYAAGLVLQKALEDAGSTELAALRTALDKMDLMTFFGRTKFSTDAKTHGKQITHDMVYVQWLKDASGKLATEIVWPLAAKSADAKLRK